MPQQVQISPKPPDAGDAPRPSRERELRVGADAGAFGMLLGALQAGEAGIVRGEVRDDSAAEWNAQDARQGRQGPRDGAQPSTPGAQEPRGALERLAGGSGAAAGGSPAAHAADEASDANGMSNGPGGPQRNAPGGREAAVPLNRQEPATAGNAVQASGGSTPATPASVAASVAAVAAAPAGAGGSGPGSSGVQPSQGSTVEAARGPQGGAARGRAPAPSGADRALRFEKAFEAQVGRGLAQALRSGDGTVTLRLRPQSLGQLSVRVQVQNNQVTATFEARNVEAQRLLEQSRGSLRQQLEARGLVVERIEVRLIDDALQTGTRLAMEPDGGADGGQDGRAFAGDRDGRDAPRGDGADGGSRRGATREDDEPIAGAEPWRALGTVRLNAIA